MREASVRRPSRALSRALSVARRQARGFTRALESALSRDADPWTRRNERVFLLSSKEAKREEGGLDALSALFERQQERK